METKRSFYLIFVLLSTVLPAQDLLIVKNPPIIVEPMFSDRGIYIQSIIDKKFQSIPKLGFFSASGILNEWNEKQAFEVMTQSYITFDLAKKIELKTGFHYSNVTGMRPTIGISYTYLKPNWFATIFPRVDVAQKRSFETFGMLENKPKLSAKINFYSRIQGTFIYNLNKHHHDRSYIYLRTGVSCKEFTFGAAGNIDYYGKMRTNKNSFGVFVMAHLY